MSQSHSSGEDVFAVRDKFISRHLLFRGFPEREATDVSTVAFGLSDIAATSDAINYWPLVIGLLP